MQLPVGLVAEPTAPVPGSTVSQFGLTISFDQVYDTGQFVNGDWWVVGSPTVTHLDPVWDGQRHGAMINPDAGGQHGYHTRVNSYSADQNVAAQLPYQLNPGDSLIVTRGWAEGDPGCPVIVSSMPGAPRPSLRDAMVLTCLSSPPPPGSFRPQYAAGPKDIYNISEVNWSLLPNLPHVANEPSWESVRDWVTRPWIDHLDNWGGRYIHPSNNLPDYGRDLTIRYNSASLKLLLDYSQIDKEEALIGAIQIGIDNAGLARNAYNGSRSDWLADFGGGHGVGRQWPTLFAATMLESQDLSAIAAYGPEWWGDIGQIYTSPGSSAATFYRPAGEPTWGERAHTQPGSIDRGRPGTSSYRTCCTTMATMGGTLAAVILGVSSLYDRPEAQITRYTDWYVDVDRIGQSNRAGSAFMETMWDTYRGGYEV